MTNDKPVFRSALMQEQPFLRDRAKDFMLVLTRFLTGLLIALLSSQTVMANEPLFFSQCRKLFPIADDFAVECQQRALPFSRTFYPSGGNKGELESYSVYFKTLDAPSNFVLGCVLNFERKISFAGLYYSAKPMDMARFNDYQIVFVDPNDNVGLHIDGIRHTLVAARQFVTDVIPARFKGAPKNCEKPHIETMGGSNATTLENFRKVDENQMEFCYGGSSCQTERYFVFGIHNVPIVYNFNDLFLIDGNGVLMLKDDYFKRACASWKGNTSSIYNIIYEMCSKANF